jgi:hypothetical protein
MGRTSKFELGTPFPLPDGAATGVLPGPAGAPSTCPFGRVGAVVWPLTPVGVWLSPPCNPLTPGDRNAVAYGVCIARIFCRYGLNVLV